MVRAGVARHYMRHMHHMIMLLYDQYIFILHRSIATLICLGDRLRLNKADELITPEARRS